MLSEAAVGVGGVVYRDVREGPGEDASAGGVNTSAVPGCRGRGQRRDLNEEEGHVPVQFWQRNTNFQWVELTELDGSWVMVGPAYAAGNVYPLCDPRIQFCTSSPMLVCHSRRVARRRHNFVPIRPCDEKKVPDHGSSESQSNPLRLVGCNELADKLCAGGCLREDDSIGDAVHRVGDAVEDEAVPGVYVRCGDLRVHCSIHAA